MSRFKSKNTPYSAPPDSLPGFNGPTSMDRRRGKGKAEKGGLYGGEENGR